MSTPSATKQNPPGFCFFKDLPTEIFHEIISHLTVIELARIQRTCKEWHNEIQKNSILWTRSGPFFEHFRGESFDKDFHQGFKALCKLSKNKLDEISLYIDLEIDGDDISLYGLRKLVRAIPKLNPTSLMITCWHTEKHHDELPTLLSQCHSLRKLTIDFCEEHSGVNIHPEKELKLDSLSLNEFTLETWLRKEASMRTLSSIKTFTLRLQSYASNKSIYDIFDYFQHFRQSIESITILNIRRSDLGESQTGKMWGKEIVFPNLIQADFADFDLTFQELDKWNRRQLYGFICPKIQELSFGHPFFWNLFGTTKSLKKLNLTREVDNLEEILQTFPCIETLKIRLKEETLRSLIKKVPDQLKYLQVFVKADSKYHITGYSLQRYETRHLLDLVKKNNATVQSNGIFWLQREGAAEFCKISVEGPELDITKFYMCKDNFLQIFTELADMSEETGSD